MYAPVQSIQEILCFVTINSNPSLAYIAVRDLQNSQHNASVQLLQLAGTTNSRRVLARENWKTFENSWNKAQYLMKH